MGSAFMVSYTRAKSEGLGFTPGTGMAAVGIMPREVRLVILSLGLILATVRSRRPPPNARAPGSATSRAAAFVALTVITLGSVLTTIQRILHVRDQAKRRQQTIRPSNGAGRTT